MEHIAYIAPESVKRAIRYSGLVLQSQSPRRSEIACLSAIRPDACSDFVRILDVFEKAYTEHATAVDALQQPLAELSPLDLLAHAGIYAFENLVPRDILSHSVPVDADTHRQSVWGAINDLASPIGVDTLTLLSCNTCERLRRRMGSLFNLLTISRKLRIG